MGKILVLDHHTIDQIAAGEVVERPSSVIKELIENAMDAKATAITVEIKNGGVLYMRVTDNGIGISKEDMEVAFLRHATSKLHDIDDLNDLTSMGFRGEALASISAVSKMECISKTADSLLGYRYEIEGGVPSELEEVGAPSGTTMIVRNLFYNVPARRKFLKSETTEGNYIQEMLEHLAMARPDISFTFINNGKTKISTAGNKDLGEIIYRIYGRETSKECFSFQKEEEGISISGVLGAPTMNKSTRSSENFFVNKRYVKNSLISKAIEEGYHGYTMMHKFPFCVIHIDIDPSAVDVNVHPQKTEIRLRDGERVYEIIKKIIHGTLAEREMIPNCTIDQEKQVKEEIPVQPEPFEQVRREVESPVNSSTFTEFEINFEEDTKTAFHIEEVKPGEDTKILSHKEEHPHQNIIKEKESVIIEKPTQISFFPELKTVLSKEARKQYEIIGQLFNTYWIITYHDQVYFIDQHAAHEKVNYERLIKKMKENAVVTQQLAPPLILSLSTKEIMIVEKHMEAFTSLGFEIDLFGGNEIALRAVPMEVYFMNEKEMFLEVLQELSEKPVAGDLHVVTYQIATMACKASVKGGKKMSLQEIDALIDELLDCENPYHCPHGRPTMFSMSKYELEKKFKRVVE